MSTTMAEPPPGYARQTDEPQCYNCGIQGHWAVACPEPTRQTPAGLEAWRNTSHATQSHGKDQRGGQKKPKCPIITRYAPPPGQSAGYPPHPGYYSGPGQYPGTSPYPSPQAPQPPGYPQPPPPPLQHSHHPSYSHPNPPYSSGHQTPLPYPPHSAPPGYSPAPHTGLPSRPDYGAHPPPPPLHSSAPLYPTTYNSFTPSIPLGPLLGQPPRSLGAPPPVPNAPGYSPHRPRHSRPHPSRPQIPQRKNHASPQHSSKPQGPASEPAPRPPAGSMAPEERIAHGLPPKPPAPSKDRADTRRERHKKKPDHQKSHRDYKHKEQSGNRRSSNHKQNRHKSRQSSQGQNLPKSSPPRAEQPQGDAGQGDRDHKHSPTESEHTQETGEIGGTMDKAHRPEPPTGDAPKQASVDTCGDDASEFEWEADAIFKEPEPRHDPDEVGKPLPSTYNEDVLLPRKWDSKCIESEFINLDNHEEFTKPVHETRYWESIQFDPAFVRDGLLPSGDALPKLPGAEDLEETSAIHREDPNGDEHVGGEPAILDRPKSHDGQPKRKRSHDSPPVNLRDQGRRNSPPRERRPPNRPRDRQTESYCPEPSRLDHCPRGNSARRESGSESRRRSPTSRRSSVSSASSSSSSLNSLDRELLGIEPKDKHGDGESKGRRGTERVPRPKRRRVQQLDSAYSRRW